jgi:hypothetical protein
MRIANKKRIYIKLDQITAIIGGACGIIGRNN